MLKTLEFVAIENAQTFRRQEQNLDLEPQDLFGLNFRFAYTKLDPKFGEITVSRVTHIYGEKQESDVNVTNCRDLINDQNWQLFFSTPVIQQQLETGQDIMCPDVDEIEV